MGVGAEVNVGNPSLKFIAGVGVRYEYSWSWREYLGPGADQWHASTSTTPLTHLTPTEHADVIAAAQPPQGTGQAVAAVLAASSGSDAWADAVSEATQRGQLTALLDECVAVYG